MVAWKFIQSQMEIIQNLETQQKNKMEVIPFYSLLAQLVERLVYIQDVGGSSPSGTTRLEAVDLVTSHF